MLAHRLWGLADSHAGSPAVVVGSLLCWPTGREGLLAVVLAHWL